MTICIGALAGNEYAIVASDRMVTITVPSTEFEHNVSKTIKVTDHCVVATAGNALGYAPIQEKVTPILNSDKKISENITKISEKIRKSYADCRKEKMSQDIFAIAGMTIEDFFERNQTLSPNLIAQMTQAMGAYNYGMSILIAGVDDHGPNIFRVDNPGRIESHKSIGHCSIGSGELHALSTFIANDYDPGKDLNHVAAMVYEAKRRSEKAQGVGEKTDICIISKNGITNLEPEQIEQLDEIYNKRIIQEQNSVQTIEDGIKKLDLSGKI